MLKFNRKIAGAVVGLALVGSAASAGLLKDIPSYWNSKIWTTWQYNKGGVFPALLELATFRQKLDKENLHDSTPALPPVDCSSPEKKNYRQADGTCNDLTITTMGSVGTRLGRNVKDVNKLVTPSEEDILYPNPLVISRELLSRPQTSKSDDSYAKVPFLNMFAAAWIQFQVHDWLDHGPNERVFAMPFTVTDAGARPDFDLSRMILPRTLKDDGPSAGYPTYKNYVTPWWDASQIYGVEFGKVSCAAADADKTLRLCQGGQLKLDPSGLLPTDASGLEVTGFNRNWWVGLTALHTLFERNHNTIAKRLQAQYPNWDDEKLFQTARLVNAAVIAKIHSVEWTPGILPNKTLDTALRANWFGLEKESESSKTVQTDAVGGYEKLCKKSPVKGELCTIIGGLLGGKTDQHGVPYSITEEFTSVYRLHSLLPENLELTAADGQTTKVSLPDVREEKAHGVMTRFGAANVMRSLGVQEPGQLIIGNYPTFMRNISVKVPVFGDILGLDMGAVDIIRDRERGVPRYNEFRRQLNLKPLNTFEDLMPQQAIKADKNNDRFPGIPFEVTEADAAKNRAITAKLKEIYKDPKTGKPNIELMDLLVGTLAEGYRPRGYGFGETLFQVFILMASRRLQADRFYNEFYNEEIYSAEGLKIVSESSFRSVLKANFSELADVAIPQNAFLPWIPKYTDPSKHWSDFQSK